LRFVDANVFIYAVVRPRREMPKDIADIKERAKSIIRRSGDGEKALTSVVHLYSFDTHFDGIDWIRRITD
jgi:hypothetical protein